MSKVRSIRVIIWNLCSGIHLWFPIGVGALFFFMGWRSASEVVDVASSVPGQMSPNVWDGFLTSFMGPDTWSAAPVPMLPWFISHLVFFCVIGDKANGELLQRGYVVVPLIGSRLRWWYGQMLTLLLVATAYSGLSIGAVLIGSSMRLSWAWQTGGLFKSEQMRLMPDDLSAEALLGWTFLLFGSTIFAMASLQTLLSILTRRSFYGLAAVSILAILSWLMGVGNPGLARWLPGSQSMLLRHTAFDPTVPSFSLEGSLLYNIVLALITIGLGTGFVRQMDLFGPSGVEIR